MTRHGLLRLTGCSILLLSACHRPVAPPVSMVDRTEKTPFKPETEAARESSPAPAASVARPAIPPDADESIRWLSVKQAAPDASAAWATGFFNPRRNKITIHTHDVQRFAIDVRRIPIDWQRVVILGIDGRNSELRRRDFSIYTLARDAHGSWIVVEP